MSKAKWRKMQVQEIHKLWKTGNLNLVVEEVVRAYEAGSTFMFGVDKLKASYYLTINQMARGIYLRPDTEIVKQDDWLLTAIAPDATLAGTVDWHEENKVIVFYVSPEKFACFWKEADQIFSEYHFEGVCFRMIPDIWFDHVSLVQFIRKEMQPHPGLKFLFELDSRFIQGIDGFALSQKFNW